MRATPRKDTEDAAEDDGPHSEDDGDHHYERDLGALARALDLSTEEVRHAITAATGPASQKCLSLDDIDGVIHGATPAARDYLRRSAEKTKNFASEHPGEIAAAGIAAAVLGLVVVATKHRST